MNATDVSGYTALHYAAQENKLDSVKLLCSNGDSVNVKTSFNKTALNIAAYKGHGSVAQFFSRREVIV